MSDKQPDWEGAYRELEELHLNLWRWLGAFADGLQQSAPETAYGLRRRINGPTSMWDHIAAIRRERLGLE